MFKRIIKFYQVLDTEVECLIWLLRFTIRRESSIILQKTLCFSSQHPTYSDNMENGIVSYITGTNLVVVYKRTIIESSTFGMEGEL